MAPVPLRLARYTRGGDALHDRRGLGAAPRGRALLPPTSAGRPAPRPLTALLDAYIVPQGVHTFVNGEPCQSFDAGTYLTNLTARFFMTGGTDLYYLSHPTTHHCLEAASTCGYLHP